jgi:hypothetical protein
VTAAEENKMRDSGGRGRVQWRRREGAVEAWHRWRRGGDGRDLEREGGRQQEAGEGVRKGVRGLGFGGGAGSPHASGRWNRGGRGGDRTTVDCVIGRRSRGAEQKADALRRTHDRAIKILTGFCLHFILFRSRD